MAQNRHKKNPVAIATTGFSMEATPGFEPGSEGFADPCLTTWLCRQVSMKNGAGDGARTRFRHPTNGRPFAGALPNLSSHAPSAPVRQRVLSLVGKSFSRTGKPVNKKWSGATGLEPATSTLAKVALYQMSYARKWCLRSESNQRHADFQSAALPTELQRHMGHLRARMENGDPERARTVDLQRDRLAF